MTNRMTKAAILDQIERIESMSADGMMDAYALDSLITYAVMDDRAIINYRNAHFTDDGRMDVWSAPATPAFKAKMDMVEFAHLFNFIIA